jgi:WD40 repeat protein/DNA-binding SARP family transcriptional activator
MEFRLLGPLEVTDQAGCRIPLGGAKQRVLLARLVLEAEHLVPADRLIVDVWGEEAPASARGSLQTYVSRLRKVLGPDRLEGGARGYLLHAGDEEIDARRFSQLVDEGRARTPDDVAGRARSFDAALRLWRGPAFDDLAGQLSLHAEVGRLEELRLAVTEEWVGARLALGCHGALVSDLEALTEQHPFREGLWGQRMLALYRSGRQVEALGAYQRLRERLAEGLGIDPSAELRDLHHRILNQDATLAATGGPLRGYRLLEEIGAGPRGVVHRAIHPQLRREVAVKVLRPEVADDPEFIRSFQEDAQGISRLEHPGSVALLDYWREPGAAYLVMQLVDGGSLEDRLIAGSMPAGQTARVLEGITQALDAAHRQGVVHGRLKPSNVLFDRHGNASLSDFGIGMPPGQRSTSSDLADLGALADRMLGRSPVAASAGTASDPGGVLPVDVLPVDIRNPYKGLRPFSEADARDFFGREALIDELVARLGEDGAQARFLAVVGPSGSGKSSLVRAGLLPVLRRDAVPGSACWFIAQMVPGTQPFAELQAALLRVAVNPLPPELAQQLAADAQGLVRGTRWALPDDASQLLLVVDQLEELFTLVEDSQEREAFLDVLATAVTAPLSRVRVVATLRADFYDRPLRHPATAALLAAQTVVVVPLGPQEVEQAVERPAMGVGVRVDPGLVDQIVSDVGHAPAALPLLQFALTEVFERRSDHLLTRDAYKDVGGLTGALARRAEEAYDQLEPRAQRLTEQVFLRLVTLGEGVADTRRRVLRVELTSLAGSDGVIDEVLERFGTARLLSFDRDPETRGPTVEVAHEALLREWRRLASWIDAAREDVAIQRRLGGAARDWLEADREASFLASGSRLQQLEAWSRTTSMVLTRPEQAFLDASLAERDRHEAELRDQAEREGVLERRSAGRLRALVAVLAVAALLAGGLSVFATGQRREAQQQSRVASARELAAAATANLVDDPERSLLLALEAVDRTRAVDGTVLPEAEEALHHAVVASRIEAHFPDVGGSLTWHPDDSVFVTEGPEDSGLVELRDATTGEPVESWHGHDVDVNDVAFSADGALLATTGDDGAARIWDPGTQDLLHSTEGEGAVWHPSFSPDGHLFAANWESERAVRVVDLSTGEMLAELGPFADPAASAFSPDGLRLAVAHGAAVKVFDLATQEPTMTLEGHSELVAAIRWSPDQRSIATASHDRTVGIWSADTGEQRFVLAGHTWGVSGIAWSPDSTRLVSGAPDGARVWALGDDGGKEILALSSEGLRGVHHVAFSRGGDRIMASSLAMAAVQIHDVSLAGGAEWLAVPGEDGADVAVAIFPDGRRLAATGAPGAVTVWDVATAEPTLTLPRDAGVWLLRVSPDGTMIAAAGGADGDDSVRVYDAATGRERFAVSSLEYIGGLAWSGDGRLLAAAGLRRRTPDAPVPPRGRVLVMDTTGRVLAELDEEPEMSVGVVAFAAGGRHLAALRYGFGRPDPSSSGARVWDWRSGEVVHEIRSRVESLTVDASGTRMATAHPNTDIEIWDLPSGQRVRLLEGGRAVAYALAFSPDAAGLASGTVDGTLRLWDVASGVQEQVLRGHDSAISALDFSADGARLASGGQDGIARVWALDVDDLVAMARRKLTRTLTEAECREYLHVARCADA